MWDFTECLIHISLIITSIVPIFRPVGILDVFFWETIFSEPLDEQSFAFVTLPCCFHSLLGFVLELFETLLSSECSPLFRCISSILYVSFSKQLTVFSNVQKWLQVWEPSNLLIFVAFVWGPYSKSFSKNQCQ